SNVSDANSSDLAELSCPACGWSSVCGAGAMLDWLRSVKMVRRDTAPDPELLGELFLASAAKFACPKCGAVGLAAHAAEEEDDEAWGMARTCTSCGRPIPRGRLEVFPDTTTCVECQTKAERGEDAAPAEYCPRCGQVMQLRPTRTAGITRYVLACPQC